MTSNQSGWAYRRTMIANLISAAVDKAVSGATLMGGSFLCGLAIPLIAACGPTLPICTGICALNVWKVIDSALSSFKASIVAAAMRVVRHEGEGSDDWSETSLRQFCGGG